jgi:hypothetical protein
MNKREIFDHVKNHLIKQGKTFSMKLSNPFRFYLSHYLVSFGIKNFSVMIRFPWSYSLDELKHIHYYIFCYSEASDGYFGRLLGVEFYLMK